MKNLFKAHEPRNVYPFFKGVENHISYVLRPIRVPTPKEAVRHMLGSVVRRDYGASPGFLWRVLKDSLCGIRLTFRGAFLDRRGNLLATFPTFATVSLMESFDICVNDLLKQHAIPETDGQFMLIADRGVTLAFGNYGTGTVTATYISPNTFTCYRNGIFSRAVNEFSHHRPRGFRSIAPHMCVTGDIEASAYFFNFSSDAAYDTVANPVAKLYRNEKEFIEAPFGEILPFGASERSIRGIFGDRAEEFLAPNGGYGTLIAEENGLTLGSIHLIRNHKTRAMSIEHTRPAHMYVV